MNPSPYCFVFHRSMSIVQLVEDVIHRAEKCNASDIHIDPYLENVKVRFRIDGILHNVCELSKNTYGEFVARIKIISGLRIDERIVPQDGRISVGEHLDIRVTIVASYHGESVVMRLLRRSGTVQSLVDLGFSVDDQDLISKTLRVKQGLILVTGPTGSGKTTTLYSLLDFVNDSSVSTITIEDPVEYAMPHARQIQVHQKRGINFANGLRSILRQDPDVIMVGEIRDKETVSIAMSAALTGHLVFSTLHTNDAISTITRCVEMGIEPYLIAATLKMVISQRLVRKLCESCKTASEINSTQRLFVEKYSDVKFSNFETYSAKGCEKCNGTGYFGRTVVAEILSITDLVRQKIFDTTLTKLPISEMKDINYHAVAKYLRGITSFDEILKIIHV